MKDYVLFLLILLGCSTGCQVNRNNGEKMSDSSGKQPNIILIYADDIGYSDIGCYGKQYGNDFIETPNIDHFAREGMKFTSAYAAAPLCSPSRAALLTGRSPARLGFEFVTKWKKDFHPWSSKEWTDEFSDKKLIPPPFTLNLPLGETTIAEVLKKDGYTTGLVGKWHLNAHYKQYFGWDPAYGPRKQGFDWAVETHGSWGSDKGIDYKAGEYPPDAITDSAIGFISRNKNNPFFLYVADHFVHTPLKVKSHWLTDKYEKKGGPGMSGERVLYAAYVDLLDHYTGELLKAIDSLGIAGNTLVIFTSDNGGDPRFAYNRPFRGNKWNLYEGGVRIPMIVRWPGQVSAGSVCDVPITQMDFMPTFKAIVHDSSELSHPIDGKSILPLFNGDRPKTLATRTFFWHFPYYHPEGDAYNTSKSVIGVEDGYIAKVTPQSSIRKGPYKLMYFYDDDRVELYDLMKDSSEQHDLSKLRPWDANELKTELFNYLYSVNARFPRMNMNSASNKRK